VWLFSSRGGCGRLRVCEALPPQSSRVHQGRGLFSARQVCGAPRPCRRLSRRICRRPLGSCFHLCCAVGCLGCLPLSHRPSLGCRRRQRSVAGGHHFPEALHSVRREVAVFVLEGHHVVKHAVVKAEAAGWRLRVPGAPPGLVLAAVELKEVVRRCLQFGSGCTCPWGRRKPCVKTRRL